MPLAYPWGIQVENTQLYTAGQRQGVRVHSPGGGGAEGATGHAFGRLGRPGVVDWVVLHVPAPFNTSVSRFTVFSEIIAEYIVYRSQIKMLDTETNKMSHK